jgi:hypothetical protein
VAPLCPGRTETAAGQRVLSLGVAVSSLGGVRNLEGIAGIDWLHPRLGGHLGEDDERGTVYRPLTYGWAARGRLQRAGTSERLGHGGERDCPKSRSVQQCRRHPVARWLLGSSAKDPS